MNNVSLIPTSEFKYGKYSFEYFNYLQSTCYPYFNKDLNLVVAAATSAGKTIVAEQNIAYTVSKGQKAIFLSPLKAVTQEKYDDWTDERHYFSQWKVEILTGDYRLDSAKVKRLHDADIILLTSEMLDTRTRYINNEDNAWITQVGVLVVDEAHLLNTNRGAALEVGLMRFTEHNPKSKCILLSATMSNANIVGKWVKGLNGKETQVISTEWRPVDLHTHHVRMRSADIIPIRLSLAGKIISILQCPTHKLGNYLISSDSIEREVAQARMSSEGKDKASGKTLVFVHAKQEGRKLCTHLKNKGIRADFHNADLDKRSRNKLEARFKSEDLEVLIATSTLAWGINMPARHVIIMGNRRGPTTVDDIDIKQMIGRAGRYGMYNRGDAFILCSNSYQLDDEFTIHSQLENKSTLAFHTVAEVYSRSIKTHEEAWNWFKRSFAAVEEEFDTTKEFPTLHDLSDIGAVVLGDNSEFWVTPYGKIARDLYLNPYDVSAWRTNFNLLAEVDGGWNSSANLAWALSNKVSSYDFAYVPKELKALVQQYQSECTFSVAPASSVYGAIFYYRLKRSQEAYSQDTMRAMDIVIAPYLQLILRDSGRTFGAIKRLDQLELWHRAKNLTVLQARIVSGVGEHLMELVSIPGVGETIATQLYKSGLTTLDKVKKNKDQLESFIVRKANITKVLRGLEKLENDTALPLA